jgi:large subunit ribosomal protein L13
MVTIHSNISKKFFFVNSRSCLTNSTLKTKGRDLWNNTFYPKEEDVKNSSKPWYIVDASGQPLGRLASLVSKVIRGKMSPQYHPAMDMGNSVIVINSEDVRVTSKKYKSKFYFRHTQNKRSGAGRIGGYRIEFFHELQERIPERIIEHAVFGMLPKDRLGKRIRVNHLKVFKGATHPHEAQTPIDITHLINSSSVDLK